MFMYVYEFRMMYIVHANTGCYSYVVIPVWPNVDLFSRFRKIVYSTNCDCLHKLLPAHYTVASTSLLLAHVSFPVTLS